MTKRTQMQKVIAASLRFSGCLVGVAIGDALGMPWETMTPKEIMSKTDGEGVTGFSDPVQTRIVDTIDMKAGDTTDDWQYTGALARSFVRSKGFDIMDCALEHVREYRRTQFGSGATTRKGLDEIAIFFETDGNEGRNPLLTAPPCEPGKGCGNGVAMKIAPVGLYYGLRALALIEKDDLKHIYAQIEIRREMVENILKIGQMTHPDIRASIGAALVAVMIEASILEEPFRTAQEIAKFSSRIEREEEEHNQLEDVVSSRDTLSTRLYQIANFNLLADPVKLGDVLGTSSLTLESVPFSIGTFMRHPTDFRAGVLEAINAGGDTDTNAAMVGAMIGANVGIEGIPPEWRNFRIEYKEAEDLAAELYQVALASTLP